jgi:hypothetical protein
MYKILGSDQKEYGPVTLEQLKQWVSEGRANANTLIQGPDSTEWKPLGSFPELAGLSAAAAASPPPGPVYGTMAATQNVPTYLWQSIVVTLCCCLPVGIVAIVYSAQVSSKLSAGDVAGAVDASKKARMWCWIAFAGGFVGFIAGIILQAMGMTLANFQQH